MNKALIDISEYCKVNIPNYEERLGIALVKMDYQRMSLSQADRGLHNEIEQQIIDYLDENEISYEFDKGFEDIIDNIISM